MAYPLSRLEVSIQTASADGLYYGRFPHGDKPSGANLSGAALTHITSPSVLLTLIKLGGAANDVASASGALTDSFTITTLDPLPDAVLGQAYSAFILAKGGVGAVTYSNIGIALPSGLSLNSSTGEISGTPLVSAIMAGYTFMATDSSP